MTHVCIGKFVNFIVLNTPFPRVENVFVVQTCSETSGSECK